MIITKVHIENFGKLKDIDFSFSEGLNQICHENGWGKSTFCVFIKAMFYGMSAKARGSETNFERTKYMPWQGGMYGGWVEFVYQNQPYRLTRYFGKTPEGDSQQIVDLNSNKTLKNPISEIGEVIFGVGKETFEITAFFPQLNFLSSNNDQIKASLTGANKYEDDLANLLKGTKIIDSKILELKRGTVKKEALDDLKRRMADNKLLINVNSSKLQSLNKEISSLEEKISLNQKLFDSQKEKQNLLNKQLAQKLSIEQSLRTKNEELNASLSAKNQLLENNKNPSKSAKTIAVILAILAVLLAGTSVYLYFKWIWGFVIGSIVTLVLAVLAIVQIRKVKCLNKGDKENINNYDQQIKQLKQQIAGLQNELAIYKDISFDEGEEKIEQELSALKIEFATKSQEKIALERDIDRLIDESDKMQSDLDEMQSEVEKIKNKIELLSKTKEFLLKAEENVSKRFIVPLNQKFKELLDKFDVNKDFVVDTSMSIKEQTAFGAKSLEFSSQGLQDILSFCQRVNLIQQMFKGEKPFLVLDDTFVNLDDKNLIVAKELLGEVAKDFQIIYICCNSRCQIS